MKKNIDFNNQNYSYCNEEINGSSIISNFKLDCTFQHPFNSKSIRGHGYQETAW